MPLASLYDRTADAQVKAAIRLVVGRKGHTLRRFVDSMATCVDCDALFVLDDAYSYFMGRDTLGAFGRQCSGNPLTVPRIRTVEKLDQKPPRPDPDENSLLDWDRIIAQSGAQA